ncbi:putative lipopolysaccharide heptosyltransferase III [Nitrosophilus labii]|uniref:putative lipopolysaccharide heptosyltransferase III n=1 Tax=Nitrosophilus labii TaxID=2706014 RepID=UPI0016570189|nr:putative lipopolysaccharide heptosyltransferase III [Nitrosophilus labii]
MKILLIKFRHIGDVLLSTALIKNLKKNFPNSKIDFVLNQESLPILKNNPNINKIFSYDRKNKSQSFLKKIKYEIDFTKQIIKNRYDIVINLTEGDRGAIISILSKAPKRLGIRTRNKFLNLLKPYTKEISFDPFIHTVEKDLQFVKHLGKNILEKKVEIYIDDISNKKIENILKSHNIEKFIIVHPVSRWLFKCWDDEKFAKVIDYIENETNFKVIITSSPEKKELDKVNTILSYCKSTPLNLGGKISLYELSALISKATLYLGVDTAPMHMAAALDIPVIALLGPTEPTIWGPWDNQTEKSSYKKIKQTQFNGKHVIIQHPNDKIVFKNGKKISTAMMSISIEEVIEQIDKALNNKHGKNYEI